MMEISEHTVRRNPQSLLDVSQVSKNKTKTKNGRKLLLASSPQTTTDKLQNLENGIYITYTRCLKRHR